MNPQNAQPWSNGTMVVLAGSPEIQDKLPTVQGTQNPGL
jgi:hypothetical protein